MGGGTRYGHRAFPHLFPSQSARYQRDGLDWDRLRPFFRATVGGGGRNLSRLNATASVISFGPLWSHLLLFPHGPARRCADDGRAGWELSPRSSCGASRCFGTRSTVSCSCRACAWRPASRNEPRPSASPHPWPSPHLSEQAGEGREASETGDHCSVAVLEIASWGFRF